MLTVVLNISYRSIWKLYFISSTLTFQQKLPLLLICLLPRRQLLRLLSLPRNTPQGSAWRKLWRKLGCGAKALRKVGAGTWYDIYGWGLYSTAYVHVHILCTAGSCCGIIKIVGAQLLWISWVFLANEYTQWIMKHVVFI